jgi:hypothetical protein
VNPKALGINIVQLYKPLIRYYNTIRSQDFIENFEDLWTVEANFEKNQSEIHPDLLNISIKTCKEKLPPFLSLKNMEFASEDMVGYVFYKVDISSFCDWQ